MAVDETRHDDFAARINEAGGFGLPEVFDSARGADLLDDAVANENRAVVDDAEVTKL